MPDDIREAAVRTWYSLLVSLLKAGSAPAAGLVDITLENHTGESDVRTVGGPGRMRAANRGCRDKLEESKSPRKHR